MNRPTRPTPWTFLSFLICCLALTTGLAHARGGTAKDLAGWGMDSAYQGHYDVKQYDAFKGVIEDIITVVPLPGMAPGTALMVLSKWGKLIQVQLGPKSYVDVSVIGLKKADKVKCMGVHATVGKQDIFIASKVKTGEYVQIKLRRTSDGVPFWAMTLAELSEFTAEFSPDSDRKPWAPPAFFTTDPHLHYTTEKPMRIFDERTPTAD